MESLMGWIAIAATADNTVIYTHSDIVILEQISEMDFGTIVKIYQLADTEIHQLKSGVFDFQIRFNNPRSTYLESCVRLDHVRDLGDVYARRAMLLTNMRGRFEHALNKHRAILGHQAEIYNLKYAEAKSMLAGETVTDGMVHDYAQETHMNPHDAAVLIVAKHDDRYQHLRKIERLRLRHFSRLKHAKTPEDFARLEAEIDKDFFINMLM